MRISVLGTTGAFHADGSPVALGGARLRALLTVLALRPGRTVPVGVLVEEVWAAEPPADAVGALQALVGRLRRALGPGAIASDGGGYRLHVEAQDVDLHRFGVLADEGTRCLAQGDAVKALSLLDDALALWRGPALDDLPDRTGEAVRWETRRLDARRNRLAAALALGRAEEVLPELVELCGRFPLDERLQALRVRALRDASRHAEALAAYGQVRRDLADRLGTDPGPELRALHTELLRGGSGAGSGAGSGDGVGTAPTGPAAPVPGLVPASVPACASAPEPAARHGNLRARLTSFVGREDDIEAIRGDLGRARLVTLLGPGGAGKTRLSQEAAESAADVWPDGVWLAELAPVNDPDNVTEAVLTALGARETVLRGAGAEELRAADRHAGEPLVRLTEHCARRRMLLLLDNCEHVIEAAAALAHELLARCPELTILATSREPLGVPGEVVRPVGPLAPDPAHRLFAERARTVRPDFDPAEDTEAVAEICRRLDGLPLAIELAAARLRLLTPRLIADRLDDRFRLLTGGSRTVLPRQQTLRAVVDWSWELLDGAERAVLRRLSVFAGGCDLPAAEVVCADEPAIDEPAIDEPAHDLADGPAVASRDVAALLGSLIDKSLVVATPTRDGGGMRYRLLETVAEYSTERLDEAGERTLVEHRHLVHFRELARTTDPLLRGPGQNAAIALFEREYENIRGALRRAVAADDEQEALCVGLSLVWFWQMRDLRADVRQWAGAVAALGPDPFARPVQQAPPIAHRVTDMPPPMSAEVLQEARRGVRMLGMLYDDRSRGNWADPTRNDWLDAVATAYRPGLPQTCWYPGSLWFFATVFTGNGDQLRFGLDETVRVCEESGYEWELAMVLHTRANVLANRGISAGAAVRDADRSLEIFERLGDAWGRVEALSARGEAREKCGDYAGAGEDFRLAVELAGGLGVQSQVILLRARLAAPLVELGRYEEAEHILREVLRDGRETGFEALTAARLFLVMVLGRSGRLGEAREQLETMLDAHDGGGRDFFHRSFLVGLSAWLDCLEGRYAQGLEKARKALEICDSPVTRMMAPEFAALHLMIAGWALAGLTALTDRPDNGPERVRDAARLIGAYEGHLPEGHFRTSLEREIMVAAREVVVAALGAAGFEAARAEGARLTQAEAVALV
ncbi:AfsR/SARP family transcriptional regulator [Streptomyces corynorhini]|uniref:AfsR family transcriptional regulator n=1 Tax=Streptomyces corynorhini TaxID=2282652 RepID=A0A370B815_9ACTN|nr:BTAD domain-containing putative transcriptional regulator [Streptomyces corynorhini]RDG36792.1 AfsR family transcriptional regulator [Streptomyces corynorhini]